MWNLLIRCVALCSVFWPAVCIPSLPSSLAGGIFPRQETEDNEFDPGDLSFIRKLGAIGDSYSAGIGAGNRLGSTIGGIFDSQSG